MLEIFPSSTAYIGGKIGIFLIPRANEEARNFSKSQEYEENGTWKNFEPSCIEGGREVPHNTGLRGVGEGRDIKHVKKYPVLFLYLR